MLDRYFDEPGERRIVVQPAISQFGPVEFGVLVLQQKVQKRVFRIRCLNDHRTWFVLPAGATAYLRDELIRAFIRAEIGEVDHPVCIENTDQAYMVEVKSLGYHLC